MSKIFQKPLALKTNVCCNVSKFEIGAGLNE